VRRLGGRIPAPEGTRWTDESAAALMGAVAELEVGPWGPLTGTVVEAKVVDDAWLGHAMWVIVEAP
jgi:hypothetical protein